VSLVELEAGLFGPEADLRRERLATLLETIPVIDFTEDEAVAYGRILTDTGFSRRKVLDRMIAAQAIVAGATLVTLNGPDFRDIPGLSLLEW
jgi:predicted nucleic acid-binding protein